MSHTRSKACFGILTEATMKMEAAAPTTSRSVSLEEKIKNCKNESMAGSSMVSMAAFDQGSNPD